MTLYDTFIPLDRRRAVAVGQTLPSKTRGAALFADISGFTPLTEAMANELGTRRGAEELTRQLNKVYGELVADVHRFGGSVIGFAGDAITCWFDQDNGLQGVACALAMQQSMQQFAQIETPRGQTVSLAIKTAVTTGPVRRFLVGDPQIQLIDVLAGQTLMDVTAAEHMAERGDVILDHATWFTLKEHLVTHEVRQDKTGQSYVVIQGFNQSPHPVHTYPLPKDSFVSALEAKEWVLAPVYERLEATEGAFLAELRPAAALFLSFDGLDYDNDLDVGSKIDRFTRWIQTVLFHYEGYLLQLIVGDKGSYLYAAFGAPVAHEDDAIRAVTAALELCRPPAEFDFITNIRIGISQGRVWSGAYGGVMRRTYGALGDEVNVAARLMGKANAGQILVSQRIADAAERRFRFRPLGTIKLKGKKQGLPVAEVMAAEEVATQRPSTLYTHPMVGRDETLAEMMTVLNRVAQGKGHILRIEGVAGIGKSHLTAEFSERVLAHHFRLAVGANQSTTQNTPYYPWRQIVQALLHLDIETSVEKQLAQVTQFVTDINPDWAIRIPLLGDLLGIPIPDNATTAAFDPRLRQEALFSLVTEIIQALSQRQPLLLLLDDVHWMDDMSQALTLAVGRAIMNVPVLLLLVQRPPLDKDKPYLPDLNRLNYYGMIDLNDLPPEATRALAHYCLGGPLSLLLRSLIQEKAHGNPFFVEELVDSLREAEKVTRQADGVWTLTPPLIQALQEAGCLIKANGDWQLAEDAQLTSVDLGIPDSIHGIVLSRIDRLSEGQKLTLKVASVMGRTFAIDLLIYARPGTRSGAQVMTHIAIMEGRDFVRLETPLPLLLYLFKHNITREVAYETLLHRQRRDLHRAVVDWYELRYGQISDDQEEPLSHPLAPYYPLLTYHCHNAEDPTRERLYASLAGQQAALQYDNTNALSYLTRALELTPTDNLLARYKLLLEREAVYDRLGEREEQAADLKTLSTITDTLGQNKYKATVSLRQTRYAEAIGDYETAQKAVKQAMAEAGKVITSQIEALTIWGKILYKQGQYQLSEQQLARALQLSQTTDNRHGQAQSLLYLGHVYHYQGNYAAAQTHYQQALTAHQAAGDLQGEAGGLNMLSVTYSETGNFSLAQEYYESALAICRKIGYRRGESIILGNLGADFGDLGHYEAAYDYHERTLHLRREIGDRWGEGISLDNLGLAYYGLGQYAQATTYCQQAVQIQQEIGDRRSQAYSLTHLGQAWLALGKWPEAVQSHQGAHQLRVDLGEHGLTMDNLAGLAEVALLQGNHAKAQEYITQVLAWIETNGIEGIEYPLQVYLTCYKVKQAEGEMTQAQTILADAHRILQERATHIKDDDLREKFLMGVKAHQEIISEWKKVPSPLKQDSYSPSS